MLMRSVPGVLAGLLAAGLALTATLGAAPAAEASAERPGASGGLVQCANLIYGDNKTSVCFSSDFLRDVHLHTSITTTGEFTPARLDSAELFMYPFAVMTGEGAFTLTAAQRDNLRDYLTGGGFLVASAGCSSEPWTQSFRREIARVFPDVKLTRLDMSHPIFHTIHEIKELRTKRRTRNFLEGLEIDGKIVLIFSSDGLNDTAYAGGGCCCCGGDEIRNAREVNANLLGYALTH
jgi:hypothetical protein